MTTPEHNQIPDPDEGGAMGLEEKSESELLSDELAESFPIILAAMLIVIGVMLAVHLRSNSSGVADVSIMDQRISELTKQVDALQSTIDDMPLQRHHEACLKFSGKIRSYEDCMGRFGSSEADARADIGMKQLQQQLQQPKIHPAPDRQ